MASSAFMESQEVEVLCVDEDKFHGSLCAAVFIRHDNDNNAVVRYFEFLDQEHGGPLVETVELTRLRPAVPLELASFTSMKDVKVGELVEGYHDDCWWRGVVASRTPGGVRLDMKESGGSYMHVRDPRLMRPRLKWVNGSWRRAVPTNAQLKELGLDAATVKAAIQAAEAAPVVPAGVPRLRTQATACPSATGGQHPPLQANEVGKPLLNPWRQHRRCDAAVSRGAGAGPGPSGAGADVSVARHLETDLVRDEAVAGPAGCGQPAAGKRRREASNAGGDAPGVGESKPDLKAQRQDLKAQRQASDGDGGRPAKRRAGAKPATGVATSSVSSRLRRDRKSRIVYVHGHPVLKHTLDGPWVAQENMYGLQDLDTMKWQRAEKTGQAAMEGVDLKRPTRGQEAPQKAREQPPKVDRQPRQQQPEVLARLNHNAAIRNDSKAAEAVRARYLMQQMDKLRPFITPQVEKALCQAAGPLPTALSPQKQQLKAASITQQPDQIRATLREYQLEGLAWLVSQYDRGINAILADEMGLGKTLQTIAFLAYLKFVRQVEGPHLVVVPLSVISSWLSEFKKWCPEMRVVRLHNNDVDERKRMAREVLSNPASFDVAVTTYEMIRGQHIGNFLKQQVVWRYLVLDEGHKLKNEETHVSQDMRHIRRQQVLMLTGTPIQNNLHELFALLNFMYPDVFTDASRFDDAFNLAKRKVDTAHLEAAHFLLRPFMLRRLKDEVEVRLPPLLETRIHCPLAEMQTFWYRRLLMRDCQMLHQIEGGDAQVAQLPAAAGGSGHAGDTSTAVGATEGTWKKAMNLLMQLRKVCNHPFMFKDAEPDFDGETVPTELITGSGKMMVLDSMLDKLKARGHRVVLFSQFNIMLDIIEDYLVDKGLTYRRLDGSTNRIQRMIDIETFNKPNSDIFIYILCTRAGGLGVNLQTADTCILFDSDWNPQWDLQAMARVHRIGQTRPVHVYRLVTGGTVEDRIQRRAEAKLYLDQMVNRGSTSNAEQLEGLSTREVLSMLRFGADRIFRNEAGTMPSEEELDAIMDRSHMTAAAQATTAAPQQAAAASADPAAAKVPNGPSRVAAAAEQSAAAEAADGVAATRDGPGTSGAALGGGERGSRGPGAGTSGGGPSDSSGDVGSGGGAGAGGLVEKKHTALDFDAEAEPVDTFTFQGVDFRELRAANKSLRDIANEYWQGKKRESRQRLMKVGEFQVLKENNYTMEEGMLHFPGQQRAHNPGRRSNVQLAGVDYAFHASCLGMTDKDAERLGGMWTCPHHKCEECGRNTAKAGSLLFRCEMCPSAYCEDDLPSDYHMVAECELFKALGQRHPTGACFIYCSDHCKVRAEEMRADIQECITKAKRCGPPGQRAAVADAKSKGTAAGRKGVKAAK